MEPDTSSKSLHKKWKPDDPSLVPQPGQSSKRKQHHILDLPPEIIYKIFSLVSTQDLLLNVARVSKSFHIIAKNPLVHRSVTFSPHCSDNFEKAEAKKFLRDCFLMKELHINWDETYQVFPAVNRPEFKNVDEFLIEVILNHDHLRVIDVCKCRIAVSTVCFAKLGHATWWQNLEKFSLNIEQNKKKQAMGDLGPAFKKLARARSLKHLDLEIPAKYLMPIILASKNLVTLKNFSAKSHNDVKAMINSVKSSLKNLEIISELRQESFELLPACHHLESLTIKSEWFNSLNMLTKLENLKDLELPVSDFICSGTSIPENLFFLL